MGPATTALFFHCVRRICRDVPWAWLLEQATRITNEHIPAPLSSFARINWSLQGDYAMKLENNELETSICTSGEAPVKSMPTLSSSTTSNITINSADSSESCDSSSAPHVPGSIKASSESLVKVVEVIQPEISAKVNNTIPRFQTDCEGTQCISSMEPTEPVKTYADIFKNFHVHDMLELPEDFEPVNFAEEIPVLRVFPF